MSGYCLDCGSNPCLCYEMEKEAVITSGTSREALAQEILACEVETLQAKIEKLEAANNILMDAVEYYSNVKSWQNITVPKMGYMEYLAIENKDHELLDHPHYKNCAGKKAREALTEVKRIMRDE